MLSYKWCIYTLFGLLSAFSSITFTATATAIQNSRKQILVPNKTIVIVVDPSNPAGTFNTIQAAINSVPSNNQKWTRIDIKAGLYREQVMIPRDKPFIYLKGEGKRTTLIVWNASDNIATGATFSSEADNTLAQDITFTNSYNSHNRNEMARAVAARIQGDKSAFHRCGFFSLQDTLWDVGGRHYFKQCTIHGAVDYIFGAGQSMYQSCTISVAANGFPGFITAQGRENPEDRNGFVFNHCNIVGKGKAYLGRPWRPYARVLFYNTSMSEAVVPQGWGLFDKTESVSEVEMSEYSCTGPGANSLERVKWAKKVSEGEAKQLADISFIDDEGWVKRAFEVFTP